MRHSALAALAALVACSSQSVTQGMELREPLAAAVFSGWTREHPRPSNPFPVPYLAVANGRSDELRLIDLSTQQALLSPGDAYPLSVPTVARPAYLAASSLSDGGADLLAVAGVGTLVDVVSTWDDGSVPGGSGGARVVARYDLSVVAGAGAEILSMAATPAPGAPAGSPPVAPVRPGRAWLILGFSGSSDGLGGKLVLLEFVRGADGSVALGGPPQVKPLKLDPISLAVGPDLYHLYVATPDVVTDFTTFPPAAGARQVLGVAEVDMSGGAAAPWPVRGLDAKDSTTLVAAAVLGERLPASPDVFGPPALRVYASLDPSGCGPQRPIACGIAVIDPALGGLAADIAPGGNGVPAQPYRAPILVPSAPLTMALAAPGASGPLQCLDGGPCLQGTSRQPQMRLIANGERWTTALGAVGAADGRTYLLDLGRSGPASDYSLLNSDDTRVKAASVASLTPLLPDGTRALAGLGLYRQHPLNLTDSPGLTVDPAKMPEAVMVTPGFTQGEAWTITWQGPLPGLASRDFVLGLDAGGVLYLAFQTAMGSRWDVGARVGDPELGIHAADAGTAGDLAQFALPVAQFGAAGNPCALATGTKYEATIASILPPAANHPGGALRLAVPASAASDPFSILCLANWLAAAPPGPSGPAVLTGTDATVRASGLVLVGSTSGYAGRPLMLTQADVLGGTVAAKRYNLAWSDESLLAGEPLVLARKARRFFYANDSFVMGSGAKYPEVVDPLAAGPALGFIVGPMCANEPPGTTQSSICPPTRMTDLLRDSALVVVTASGVYPTARRPTPSSLPSFALSFDRSLIDPAAGAVFYVTYHEDSILLAVPGQTINVSTTLR